MISGASLSIAAVYLVVWLKTRESPAFLMFALMTASISLVAAAELWMLHATTAAEFATAVRWFQVPVFAAIASCVGLVHYQLRSPRLWIGQMAIGLRAVSLVLNFTTGVNLNYLEISELGQFEILGEQASYAIGVPNPLMLVAQLSLVMLLVYVVDAAVATWRRKEDRLQQALSIVLLLLIASGFASAVVSFWGIAPVGVIVSPFFIGVAVVMGIGLSVDLLRSAQLERDLRTGRERLDALSKAAALSEMSASIAHEINQPLGVILSNAEAAEVMLESNEPDLKELKDIVTDIIHADRRAANVIARLRSLLERGGPDLNDVPINDAVLEAVGHIRSGLGADGVNVHLDLDSKLPTVSADRILIVQLAYNLLNNACAAVAGVSRGRRRVAISSRSDEQTVTMTVSDNGHGLPENKEVLFDPFVTTKASGLGMGLAIAKSIVDAHEGRIWVESESG